MSPGSASSSCPLALCDVGRAFGPRVLFRNINLELQPGLLYLLLGANGAGKTTLMKIMAGLTSPDIGKVTWNVKPDKVAYLGHATFLYPGLSALENLEFWAGMSGLDQVRERSEQALKVVGLERHSHERAGIFSRGMAQRLNLARLLLADADLLLLDEPGTGLDIASRALLHSLVDAARSEGTCVVWISHDPEADGALADRLLLLEQKKLREEAGGRTC